MNGGGVRLGGSMIGVLKSGSSKLGVVRSGSSNIGIFMSGASEGGANTFGSQLYSEVEAVLSLGAETGSATGSSGCVG